MFFTKILQLIFFLHLFCCIHALFIDTQRETSPWTPWFVFPPKQTKELFKQLKILKEYNSEM